MSVGGRTMMSQQPPFSSSSSSSSHEEPRQDPVHAGPPPDPASKQPTKEKWAWIRRDLTAKWSPLRQSTIALILAAASLFILPFFLAILGVTLGGRVLLFRRDDATPGALVMSALAVLIGIGSFILYLKY
jgi:hypothetical protein